MEAADGGESGGGQQGPPEAPLGQRGPRAAVPPSRGRLRMASAASRTVINPRAVCVLIRESVYMKMRQLLSRNISVYQQLLQFPHIFILSKKGGI